jgi:hypothetical protein
VRLLESFVFHFVDVKRDFLIRFSKLSFFFVLFQNCFTDAFMKEKLHQLSKDNDRYTPLTGLYANAAAANSSSLDCLNLIVQSISTTLSTQASLQTTVSTSGNAATTTATALLQKCDM